MKDSCSVSRKDIKNTALKDFLLMALGQAFVNKVCTISRLILTWGKSAE